MQPGDECVDRRRLTAKNPPHPRRDYPRFYLLILPYEPMTAVIYLSGRDGTCRLLLPTVIARICQQGTRLCRVELCGWIGDREQTFLSRLPCSVLFLNDARWQERLCLDLDMQISPWHHPCLMEFVMFYDCFWDY